MSDGVTTDQSSKKKSLDDLGSRVLERLRAKRRKYKKNVDAKNAEKEQLKKLQAMEKVRKICAMQILGTHFVLHTQDARAKGDIPWAKAIKKKVTERACT